MEKKALDVAAIKCERARDRANEARVRWERLAAAARRADVAGESVAAIRTRHASLRARREMEWRERAADAARVEYNNLMKKAY